MRLSVVARCFPPVRVIHLEPSSAQTDSFRMSALRVVVPSTDGSTNRDTVKAPVFLRSRPTSLRLPPSNNQLDWKSPSFPSHPVLRYPEGTWRNGLAVAMFRARDHNVFSDFCHGAGMLHSCRSLHPASQRSARCVLHVSGGAFITIACRHAAAQATWSTTVRHRLESSSRVPLGFQNQPSVRVTQKGPARAESLFSPEPSVRHSSVSKKTAFTRNSKSPAG